MNLWQSGMPAVPLGGAIGSVVGAGQQLVSQVATLYAQQHLGLDVKDLPDPETLGRKGISLAQEYLRPFNEASEPAALNRLETMVRTDLQLAKVQTIHRAYDSDNPAYGDRPAIRVWKRVHGRKPLCPLRNRVGPNLLLRRSHADSRQLRVRHRGSRRERPR